MARIIIAHSPYSDTATLALGGYAAGLPRDNMKNEKLFQVARTTDATLTNTQVRADLTASPPAVSALIAGPTNLTAAGLFRVMGAPTTAFSSGYTSGWLSPGVSAADIDTERGLNIIHVMASPQTYRYWRLEIDDTANPAGYIEIGRLSIGKVLAPSVNYAPGSNGMTWEDLTRRQLTLSGVRNRSRRRNRRLFNFAIPYLPENEVFGDVYQFERTVGFDKLVFVIPDPALTGARLQGRSFWGSVAEMDAITQAQIVGSADFGLTISEEF